MTYAPRVPKEEASFADTVRAVEDAVDSDRRDLENRVRRGQPDDSTLSPHEKGRFGNLKQNLTNQWKVRESSAVTQDLGQAAGAVWTGVSAVVVTTTGAGAVAAGVGAAASEPCS